MRIFFLGLVIFSGFAHAQIETATVSRGSARLAASYKFYSYTNEPNTTVRLEGAYNEPHQWSAFAHFNYNHEFGQNAYHFRLSGSYWLSPDWKVTAEGGYCNNDIFLPNVTLVTSLTYTHFDWLTADINFYYTQDTNTRSGFFSPHLAWSPSKSLRLEVQPIIGFSHLTSTNENVWSATGFLFGRYSALTWLSLLSGISVGNMSFDYIGTPEGPLLGVTSISPFILVEFLADRPFSFGSLVAAKWVTDNTNEQVIRLFGTYRW